MASAATTLRDQVALKRGKVVQSILGDPENAEPGKRTIDHRAVS